MIETVTSYKSSDGSLHNSLEKAHEREVFLFLTVDFNMNSAEANKLLAVFHAVPKSQMKDFCDTLKAYVGHLPEY